MATISNSKNNTIVTGTSSADSIYNTGDTVTVSAGDGFDTVRNEYGHNVKISLGAGNDFVYNYHSNSVSINGGAGNDSVYNSSGVNTTIAGGAGDDTVSGYGVGTVYIYNAGDGNDIIYGINDGDTVYIPSGSWTRSTVGSNIVLTIGTGKLTLNGAATLPAVNITSSESDIHPVNIITNTKSNTIVTGTAYADSIYNYYNSVTVNAGAGNDTINNLGDTVTIDGGAGNDSIYNASSSVTIDGGAGNDSISLSDFATKNVIKVGAGDDTVYGYNPSDTVSLTSGSVTSSSVSGSDLILKTTNGSVRFVGTRAVKVGSVIYGNTATTGTSSSDTITNFANSAKISALAGNDLIQNGGANVSINTGDGFDTVKNYGSNATIRGGSNSSYIYNHASAKIFGGAGNDSVYNLYADNTFVDSGAGNDSIENWGASVSIDGGNGADYILNGNGGKYASIHSGAGNDTIRNYGEGYVSIDAGDGNDYIESYNNYYSTSISGGAGSDTIKVAPSNNIVTINGATGNDFISLSSYAGKDLLVYKAGDGNDSVTGFKTTDTLKIGNGTSDTFTSVKSGSDVVIEVGMGKITLTGAASLSTLNVAGKYVASTVAGVKINNYTNSTLISTGAGNDTIYNNGDSVTIDSGAGNDSIYASGDKKVSINSGAGDDTVFNGLYGAKATIVTGEGDDSVYNGYLNAERTKISLGAGNDTVRNFSDYVSIDAGTGNDLIIMNKAGQAVIEYANGDGDDTIYGFNPSDTLRLTGGTITGSVISGDDLILKIGTGSIKLLNTRSVNLGTTIFNPTTSNEGTSGHDFLTNFSDNATVNGNGGDDKIANRGTKVLINTGEGDNSVGNYGYNSTIITGNGNNTIYNHTYQNEVLILAGSGKDSIHNDWSRATIDAGAGDDTIVNHYISLIQGGAGNDVIRDGNDGTTEDGIAHHGSTLIGGTGNDTIYAESGWEGTTTFEYTQGDGYDVVYSYGANDTIKIYGEQPSTVISDNDVILKVGEGSITLKNAKGIKLNVVVEDYNPKLIKLTENADTYSNTLDGATILALGGADSITNSGASVSVDLGAGNDWLKNNTIGADSTITGGEGNDTIINLGENVSIDGGAGDDSIFSTWGTYDSEIGKAFNVSVSGGAGNDTITGAYLGRYDRITRINGDEGDDYIYNTVYHSGSGGYITIDGGTGNDTIKAGCGSISGGAGNDSINIGSGNTTITVNGGLGDDTVFTDSANVNQKIFYQYTSGDGNDSIIGFKTTDTLKIGNGTSDTFTSVKSGSDVVIEVGTGKVTLTGAASLSTLNVAGTYVNPSIPSDTIVLTEGNDTYNNTVDGVTILALGGSDSITNTGASVSIDGGADGDWLENKGANVTITGGEGEESLRNYGASTRADLGAGDDRVTMSNATGNTLLGGEGNDWVLNSSASVSIDGGADDDSIDSMGLNATLIGGDGNDSIRNKSGTGTIDAGAGSDSIVAMGTNYIDAGADNDFVTVFAGGKNSTILSGAGDDYIQNIANNVTFLHKKGDGLDTIDGFRANSTLLTDGAFTLSTVGNNLVVKVGADTTTLLDAASLTAPNIIDASDNPLLIVGTEGNDTINNSLDGATILALEGDDKVTNRGASVSIDAGADDDYVLNTVGANVTIDGGAGNDNIENYYADKVSIVTGAGLDTVYHYGNSKTGTGQSVTADTGDDNDRIYNYGGSNVSIAAGAGDDYIMSSKTSLNVTLDGGDGDDQIYSYGKNVTIIGGTGNDSMKNDDGANVLFKYASGDGDDTILGFNETDTLQIGDGTGSYSKTTLDNGDVEVTVGEGKITLVGAASLGSSLNIDGEEVSATAQWKLDGTTATYGTETETLITVSGVKSLDGISLEGNVVTISAASLDKNEVTISDGYTLALGTDVSAPTTVAANYDADTQTYTSAGSVSYKLSSDGKSISYSGTSKDFKFSGIADDAILKGFFVSDKKKAIAIGASAINPDKTIPVKLLSAPEGYKLELGSSLPKAKTISANTYDVKTMTYKTKGTTGSYTLSNDGKTISYSEGTSKEFKFSGIADDAITKGFFVNASKKTIAIGASAINPDKTIPVKLLSAPEGYKLELGSSLPKAKPISANTYDAKTMTYKTKGTTGTYKLSSDGKTISYVAGTSLEFTFSGIADDAITKGFFVSDKKKTIAIGASAINPDKTIPVKLLSAPEGYKLELGSSLPKAKTVGTSTLEDGFYTAASQTAGYTLSHDAKTIKYREALDTVFELDGIAAEPKAPSNGVVTLTPENFDKRLSVMNNEAEYAFALAKGTYTGKTFTGSSDADTITSAGASLTINGGKGNDEITNSGASVKINGGLGNDYVKNSGSNVTLNGGTGNDTLWGGSYADTFVYKSGDGKDIIGGFDNDDLLQITGTFTTAYDSAADTIKFTIGTGSITLTDYTATTFNVNGDSYQIKGTKLVKQ